jgi:outer membrane protein OmpA-like peptidoglycan-associated protein
MKIIKQLAASTLIAAILTGCVGQGNNPQPGNNTGMTKTQQGALIGGILGAVLGGVTKGKSKGKRALIGGAIGAAIGGGIGYSMDQQAKEIAQTLETDVNNNPNAAMNPDNDLIVSNTDQYVKIMLRDSMVFATNSAIPTATASRKIAKISAVLKSYPNTIVQVVGFTDNRGSYTYNQKLSEQRASNVGNTLYNSGISNQVFTKGCSYNKPIASNTTKENMALNRRVEIYLYPNQNSIIDACVQ